MQIKSEALQILTFFLYRPRVNILADPSYLFPLRYLNSSHTNLNFVVIPPWLEKILNLAPLKCLDMLLNIPNMWKLSDQLTATKS